MSDRQAKGREAENKAAEFLLSLGYCIVTRNFRVRGGEIDIVCLDADTIVFVEVKGRFTPGYVPEEGIGRDKLASLRRAGREYLTRMEEKRLHRFDVIAMDGNGLRHHKHIFNV
jgi:putative endonuclease